MVQRVFPPSIDCRPVPVECCEFYWGLVKKTVLKSQYHHLGKWNFPVRKTNSCPLKIGPRREHSLEFHKSFLQPGWNKSDHWNQYKYISHCCGLRLEWSWGRGSDEIPHTSFQLSFCLLQLEALYHRCTKDSLSREGHQDIQNRHPSVCQDHWR